MQYNSDMYSGVKLQSKTFKGETFNNTRLWSYFDKCKFIDCSFINYTQETVLNLTGGVYTNCKFIECTFDNPDIEIAFYKELISDSSTNNSVTKTGFSYKKGQQ